MLKNLFFRRNKKIEKILNTKIILINGIEEKYSNLCLKNYGLPLKVKERDKVQVIFPRSSHFGERMRVASIDIEMRSPLR